MNKNDNRIEQIYALLDEINGELRSSDEQAFIKNFDALEIPQVVSDIVCYLQPMLMPYEAAIYWYMFQRSILRSGDQYCRVSTRGLMKGVVRSMRADILAIKTTRESLQGLEKIGAIVRVGEPSRDGTPYKVLLPEEIPACLEMKKNYSPTIDVQVEVSKDLDYYNVRENRLSVFERDNYLCKYCGKQLTRFTATLDHIQPVSKGGDNSIDNLVTACLHCNSIRGNRPVMDIVHQRLGN